MSIQSEFAAAAAEYERGQWSDAESRCRRILAREPSLPEALHLLGVILSRTQRGTEGIPLIQRAVAGRPDRADFHRNLGAALRLTGRLPEAIESYRAAVRLQPAPELMLDLCSALHEQGNLDEAEEWARRAMALAPRSIEPHLALGTLLMARRQFDAATQAFHAAIRIDPMAAEPYKRLGLAFHHRGQFEQAVQALRRADQLRPNDPVVMNQIGLSLQRLARRAEAETWFHKTLGIEPRDAEAFYERGNALDGLQRYEEAVESFRAAERLDPRIWPGGLGVVLEELGRTDEAMECYDRAMRRQPNHPVGHLNRGILLLFKGRYAEGWREYAWRWKCPTQHTELPPFSQPLWNGEDLAGKSILLYPEQGLGDTILALRYAPLVARRGPARVIVILPGVAQSLEALVRRSMPEVQVVTSLAALPPFDLHVPLLNVPMILGTTLESIPATVPYLRADPAKVQAWRDRLGPDPRLKVGLVWAGNPTNPGDYKRSMPLSAMSPLAAVAPKGIRFISLQKGPAAAQAAQPPAGMALEDHTDALNDFDDTAALIECLDLVVAVDTSVAHLAGALAQRVWVPLPVSWYWVWMERREDSPWYPTLRLFRQSTRNSWAEPMARIATALAELVKSSNK